MIKNFVKILELLGDRLEVCVSVYIWSYWCHCKAVSNFEMPMFYGPVCQEDVQHFIVREFIMQTVSRMNLQNDDSLRFIILNLTLYPLGNITCFFCCL